MTLAGKKKALTAFAVAAVGGGVLSLGSLMVFFGGSDRDPPWVWTLYVLCLLGGGLVSLVGVIGLFVVSFLPTE